MKLISLLFLLSVLVEVLFRERDLEEHLHKFDLVVVIPSARHNFQLRKVLRETWFGNIKRQKTLKERICALFVIGSQPCHIHPSRRHTPYVCQLAELIHPVIPRTVMSMRVSTSMAEPVVPVGPVGYDFQINFPIAISALGVFDYGSDGLHSNVTVTLYDTTTQREITHVTFTPDNPGIVANGVRFRRCAPSFVLVKEFRASIVAEGFTKEDPSAFYSNTSVDIDTGGGLISYLNVSRTSPGSGLFPGFDYSLVKEPTRFVAAAFIFEAHVKADNGSQTESIVGDSDEYKWLKELEKEEKLLQEEAVEHGDILLVDVVDVYRNIPAKMKSTYEWISRHIDFRYLLKTDDDCFVHIEQILKDLNGYQLDDHKKVWWGNFRTHWGVEKFGKWVEVDYTAPIYPAFACGSGYVASADLIHWIGNNADSLKLYQGEDVCMGIWLSAVGPSLLKDPRWECFSTCYPDLLALPEQDADSLLQLWTNLHQCGNPCWCQKETT